VPESALPARELPLQDAELFAAAARRDPGLAVLAAELAGREDALEVARKRYLPDISPHGLVQRGRRASLGLEIGIPIGLSGLRAGVEAGARRDRGPGRRAARPAPRHGGRVDRRLLAFREAERTLDCCENLIEPLAARIAASNEAGYAAGTLPQREWLESLALRSEARIAVAEARAQREIALARIEALVGGDLAAAAAEAQAEAQKEPHHG
jgi:outer membrane protein TolC